MTIFPCRSSMITTTSHITRSRSGRSHPPLITKLAWMTMIVSTGRSSSGPSRDPSGTSSGCDLRGPPQGPCRWWTPCPLTTPSGRRCGIW